MTGLAVGACFCIIHKLIHIESSPQKKAPQGCPELLSNCKMTGINPYLACMKWTCQPNVSGILDNLNSQVKRFYFIPVLGYKIAYK